MRMQSPNDKLLHNKKVYQCFLEGKSAVNKSTLADGMLEPKVETRNTINLSTISEGFGHHMLSPISRTSMEFKPSDDNLWIN